MIILKDNIMRKLNVFMRGRYGNDDMSRFLNYIILVLLVLGIFVSAFFSNAAFALIVFVYFRMLSKNINARSSENAAFLGLKRKITTKINNFKTRFKQRKTHRFYSCPGCKVTVRISKGDGKTMTTVTCPKCKTQFERRK